MSPVDGCGLFECTEDGIVIRFDHSVYRLSAVKAAAYKFGDRCHVLLSDLGNGQTQVNLRIKAGVGDPAFFAGEFCNEVLDQELREVVAEQTEGLRNLLLAHTFSQTSIVGAETEKADYRSDPLGILKSDGHSCFSDE